MNRHKAEGHVDLTNRLRQIQQLLEAPIMVAPRTPADNEPERLRPLLDVEPHEGRMYVAGHEPHFQAITLLHVRRDGAAERS